VVKVHNCIYALLAVLIPYCAENVSNLLVKVKIAYSQPWPSYSHSKFMHICISAL